jgi:hypothetical protein
LISSQPTLTIGGQPMVWLTTGWPFTPPAPQRASSCAAMMVMNRSPSERRHTLRESRAAEQSDRGRGLAVEFAREFLGLRFPLASTWGVISRSTKRSPAMSYDALTRSQKTAGLQGRGMLDFIQQLVSGIALGCVYGLIALGFVLIYKATEVVNFAQGDLMMLGGFFVFTFIGLMGLDYWLGFLFAVCAMAVFGMATERILIRPILGYPQFSIVMATIGLGYFLRSVAGMIWGTDDLKIETPFSTGVFKLGDLVIAHDKLSVIVATVILCAVLYAFFNYTKDGHRHAGHVAEPAGGLLHGHPGAAGRLNADLGDQPPR